MSHKLLLADDSVTIQRVIELTFADEDVQVIAVGDGLRAIERIEADRPDIVLADVGMPERDGYEVASFVKNSPHLAHVPVVLLTGAFEPVDEARAKAIGCEGVLVKPFEPQLVINRVRDLLAGRRQAAPWAANPAHVAGGGKPAQAARAAAPEADLALHPPAEGAASAESLDAYFDRLDAAFASHGAAAPPAPAPPSGRDEVSAGAAAPAQAAGRRPAASAAPASEWDDWDPGPVAASSEPPAVPAPAAAAPAATAPTATVPTATVPTVPTAAVPTASTAAVPTASTAPAAAADATARPTVQPLPLADAFAALLAAEQRLPAPAGPAGVPAGAGVPDDLVEEVTRRVLTRVGEQALPDAVREVVLDVAERLVREEIERIKAGAT